MQDRTDPRDAEITRLRAENQRVRHALVTALARARRRADEHAHLVFHGDPDHARRREGMEAAYSEMGHVIQQLHAAVVANGSIAAHLEGMPADA
mgnify:CR=1 FL=1